MKEFSRYVNIWNKLQKITIELYNQLKKKDKWNIRITTDKHIEGSKNYWGSCYAKIIRKNNQYSLSIIIKLCTSGKRGGNTKCMGVWLHDNGEQKIRIFAFDIFNDKEIEYIKKTLGELERLLQQYC